MTEQVATIAVIGSLNVDLVTRTTRIPNAGETLTAKAFDIGFGGKGANQAVACARLSRTATQAAAGESTDVNVQMIGAVGSDPLAQDFKEALRHDGLDISGVVDVVGEKTGTASIIVEEETGENRIMISPGANYKVKTKNLLPAKATVAVFQLEIPHEVVFRTIEEAKSQNVKVVFNPAPAVELPEYIYKDLDHLIVNETEASLISGLPELDVSTDDKLQQIADKFLDKGVKHMIITLGGRGVFFRTQDQKIRNSPGILVPAQRVKVIDTTAAGDTFVGAYSVALARSSWGGKFDVTSAISHANSAAAVTVQRQGAQSAIPWVDEVA